jgi:hypothetical protein
VIRVLLISGRGLARMNSAAFRFSGRSFRGQ